jgi:hypothetical protein
MGLLVGFSSVTLRSAEARHLWQTFVATGICGCLEKIMGNHHDSIYHYPSFA